MHTAPQNSALKLAGAETAGIDQILPFNPATH
jgi:hypothetical protein